jgi:hypothetical protein
MRIASNFKDYYDSASSFGVDTTKIFVRNTTKKCIVLGNPYRSGSCSFSKDLIDTKNAYPFLFRGDSYDVNLLRTYLKNINYSPKYFDHSIIAFAGKLYDRIKIDDKIFFEYDKSLLDKYTKHNLLYSFVYSPINNPEKYKEIFISRNEPIVLFQRKFTNTNVIEITYNCSLKDLNFQMVKSPYEAFQELDMFIGGIISQKENELVKIEDKFLIKAKGFDDKSFKKEPTKRKKLN